jgi:hypothetical protein
MRKHEARGGRFCRWLAIAVLLLAGVSSAWAQGPATPASDPATATPAPAKGAAEKSDPWMDIYGFAMLDIGQNFKQIDPNWFDTLRLTKLPSYADQFGKDNSTFAGVRQSRFGVRASTPTDLGDLKARFEIDMFGTGVDAGQTTIRLRHAWGEPVRGSGCVAELARVLGADGYGVLPQRAGALDAAHGREDGDARDRAAGRER